jgi:hypothetical protein
LIVPRADVDSLVANSLQKALCLACEMPLFQHLAELEPQGTIEGDALRKSYDANASPLNFDELETNTTY